jgi:hypothetical protein
MIRSDFLPYRGENPNGKWFSTGIQGLGSRQSCGFLAGLAVLWCDSPLGLDPRVTGEYERPEPLARYDRGPPAGKKAGSVGTFPVRDVVPGYCRARGRGSITVSGHRLSAMRLRGCKRDPATLNRMGAFL